MIRDVTGHGAFPVAGGRAEDGKPRQPNERGAEPTGPTPVERSTRQPVVSTESSGQRPAPAIGRELRYEVDEDLNQVVIKILDGDSGEVVRQIPAEELVRLAKVLEWAAGQLLDRRA